MRVRNTVHFCLGSLILLLASSQATSDTLGTIRIALAEQIGQAESTVNGQRTQDALISPLCLTPADSRTVFRDWQAPAEKRQSNILAMISELDTHFAVGCPSESEHSVRQSVPVWQWFAESLVNLNSGLKEYVQQVRRLEYEYRCQFLNRSLRMGAARITAQRVAKASQVGLLRFGQISYNYVSGWLLANNDGREATVPVSIVAGPPTGDVRPASKLENDDRIDAYWQYYEDCDYWNVIFAGVKESTNQSVAKVDADGNGHREKTNRNTNPATVTKTRNVFPLLNASQKLVQVAGEALQRQIAWQEFRLIESAGVDWPRLQNRRANSFLNYLLLSVQIEVLREKTVTSAFLNASDAVKKRIGHVFQGAVIPLIQTARIENARIQAAREQGQIEFDKRIARTVGWIGRRLVGLSDDMMQELEIQSCELDSESRFARRASDRPVK